MPSPFPWRAGGNERCRECRRESGRSSLHMNPDITDTPHALTRTANPEGPCRRNAPLRMEGHRRALPDADDPRRAGRALLRGNNRFFLTGTRKVVAIVNEGDAPALVQASLAWGDKDSSRDLPVVVSKPLLRIVPGGRATTELFYQGRGLPQDRESYFVLSVLDVPPVARAENTLQLAIPPSFQVVLSPSAVFDAGRRHRRSGVGISGG